MTCWNKDEFKHLGRRVTFCSACKATYFETEEDGQVLTCPRCGVDTVLGYMVNYGGPERLVITKKTMREAIEKQKEKES